MIFLTGVSRQGSFLTHSFHIQIHSSHCAAAFGWEEGKAQAPVPSCHGVRPSQPPGRGCSVTLGTCTARLLLAFRVPFNSPLYVLASRLVVWAPAVKRILGWHCNVFQVNKTQMFKSEQAALDGTLGMNVYKCRSCRHLHELGLSSSSLKWFFWYENSLILQPQSCTSQVEVSPSVVINSMSVLAHIMQFYYQLLSDLTQCR